MKKHITPYLLILLLILILSGGTFYLTRKYSLVENTGGAVFYSSKAPIRAIDAQTNTGPVYQIQLMHGTCVVIATDRNGNNLGSPYSYAGHFNASYDCVPDVSTQQPNRLVATFTNSGGGITTKSSTAYLNNAATISILEAKLIALGVLNQTQPTGTFSLVTFNAIKALQTKNNIPATGYLDSATLELLDKVTFQKGTSSTKNYLQLTTPTTNPSVR